MQVKHNSRGDAKAQSLTFTLYNRDDERAAERHCARRSEKKANPRLLAGRVETTGRSAFCFALLCVSASLRENQFPLLAPWERNQPWPDQSGMRAAAGDHASAARFELP
jgi:hypothetical protein